MAPIEELSTAYHHLIQDEHFLNTYHTLLKHYVGRPTPLTEVQRFSDAIDGPRLFLKREDLLHTGAHKINNAMGQCLLAKRLGKTRVIAETGAGQHGVATATACAYFGLSCVVYMGGADIQRQMPNVQRMQLLGAEVRPVESGARTLKDAVSEAMRDWSAQFKTTHYCLGSALGPHPYPAMVSYFQSVIGEETRRQCEAQCGRLPDLLVACVGGGSNAVGLFAPFLQDDSVQMVGVEAGGAALELGQHAARFQEKQKGVLHGCYTYLLQTKEGQIAETESIAAGLDYPAVGPQHAAWFESGRVQYTSASDADALAAFKLLTRQEGIIPALESAHALAYVQRMAPTYPKDHIIVVNLSGRGDKDLPQLLQSVEGIV